jgi:hypothetical protein
MVRSAVVAPLADKLEHPKIGYVSLALAPSRSVVPFNYHRFLCLLAQLCGTCLRHARLPDKVRTLFHSQNQGQDGTLEASFADKALTAAGKNSYV